MKLSRVLALTVLGGGAVGLAGYMAACSSGTSDVTPAGINCKGGAGSCTPPVVPPATTPGLTPATTEVYTFAINALQLGDADRTGAPSPNAWKAFGYNIDGKITNAKSTDVCRLAPNAGASIQIDGNNGIDNSFGQTILPTVMGVGLNTPSKTLSDSIDKGSFTILLRITGLSVDPKQTSLNLSSDLFAGGAYNADGGGIPPAFDMTTDWPVRPELLNDGKTVASGSKVHFGNSYVSNGTWVNGVGATLTLSLAFGGVALDLTVNQATITFDHTAPTDATNGTIAGVIETSALIAGLRKVAGRIDTSLCVGTTFEGIAAQIAQASDILKDGTNVPGVDCDGISIGLGFTAKRIKEPDTVADVTATSPDPCMDAGTVAKDGG